MREISVSQLSVLSAKGGLHAPIATRKNEVNQEWTDEARKTGQEATERRERAERRGGGGRQDRYPVQ